jgi:hypothetical protein
MSLANSLEMRMRRAVRAVVVADAKVDVVEIVVTAVDEAVIRIKKSLILRTMMIARLVS